MDRIFFCVVLLVLVSCVGAQGDDFFMRVLSSGNAYGVGGDVAVNEYFEKDLVVAGGNVIVNGDVKGDLTVAGGNVVLNGDVGEDLRVAGGRVAVNGNVAGELVVVAGNLEFSEGSRVEGDALISGGSVSLDGKVMGDTTINAGDLNVGGGSEVLGKLNVRAGGVEELARGVEGIPLGDIREMLENAPDDKGASAVARISFLGSIRGMVAAILLGVIIIYLYPNPAEKLAKVLRKTPVKAFITGLVMMMLIPVTIIMLLITLVGFRVAAILGLLTFTGVLIATFPVKLVVGEAIYKRLTGKKSSLIMYYCTGVLAFALFYSIPVIGWLVKITAGLAGFGALWIQALHASTLKKRISL